MKIGTKSVLFGAHCFFLHPWFVAWAWWKLYGFPWDPRLWVAFFVHDLGYIGKPNMDGEEGEAHPVLGARIMSALFDPSRMTGDWSHVIMRPPFVARETLIGKWGQLCLFHSRYFAKKHGQQFSRLCVADKLATLLTPGWLYLPMVRATGEIKEYMARGQQRVSSGEAQHMSADELRQMVAGEERAWYAGLRSYMQRWVEEHKDGRADTWTPIRREAIDATGVTQ